MLQRVEVLYLDDRTEIVEGDDVAVKDGVLHVWYRRYNTGHSFLPDVHRGSFPLASMRRWRILEGP